MLDGKSEIGAHVWNQIGHEIYSNHLFRLKALLNLKSIFKKGLLFFTSAQLVLVKLYKGYLSIPNMYGLMGHPVEFSGFREIYQLLLKG